MGIAMSGLTMNDIEDTVYGKSLIHKRFKTNVSISVTTRRLDENNWRVPLINNSEKSDNSSNLNPEINNVMITIRKIGLCFTVIGVKRFDSLSGRSPRIYVKFDEDVNIGSIGSIGSDMLISTVEKSKPLENRPDMSSGPIYRHPYEWVPTNIENVESPVVSGVTLYDSNKLYLSEVPKFELEAFDFGKRTPGDNFEHNPCEIYEDLLVEIE